MIGIEKFKEFFAMYESEYVIIGGTACELLMSADNLQFRATKDIDMVLIIEQLTKDFGMRFWEFIQEAEYQFINKGTGKAQFYRFSHPKSTDYPAMIELFSKKPEWISIEMDRRYSPIAIDEDVSSLSAIILDDEYYELLKTGKSVLNGLSLLSVDCIIPFKAKAWIDLVERKQRGDHIDQKDIKKHKNDVFRLSVLLIPNNHINVPDKIKKDMNIFIDAMKKEDVNLKQLGITGVMKEEILKTIHSYYKINEVVSIS